MIVRLVWTLLSPNRNPALAARASMSGLATCWSILDIVPGARANVNVLQYCAGTFAGAIADDHRRRPAGRTRFWLGRVKR